MRRYIFIVSFLLLIICILPVSYFVVRHFTSLTENEKMVQEVFEGQMEAILYSLNQQTENIVSLWVNKLDMPVDCSGEVMTDITTKLFDNNPAILSIRFLKKNGQPVKFERGKTENLNGEIISDSLSNRLIDFKAANYQRIEPVRDGQFTHFCFAPFNVAGDYIVAVSVSTPVFVEQNLSARIQQVVAGQSFQISVVDTLRGEVVYRFGSELDSDDNEYRKNSLYLPGYVFSIGLQSATIDELVYQRSRRDNYIFLGLLFFMVVGLIFIIASIRKEILLTEMKSDFVSNVSHEIRTPLALISMYAETLLLDRVKNDAKKKEYFRVINFEANRLNDLVNRILSFSRLEKKKRKYHFASVELNGLIHEINESYMPHYGQYGVDVALELSNNPLCCLADREALTECIVNLIDNAIKYGKESGKTITFRSGKAGTQVFVEVEDNGIGIPRKYQKHIFDKFYRVTSGNLAHVAKGSGLGLNIVYQIMKAHGGNVSVESEEGKGSRFKLIIPGKIK
ncbi:MAG: HAMP domain-containing histidine kinase [Prolixibacteraceae bacterium]|nr:HAMP domain-containing histidine kinase [Prolixibacteraceae bacterium]